LRLGKTPKSEKILPDCGMQERLSRLFGNAVVNLLRP